MISRHAFLSLYSYSYWARDEQLTVCGLLSEEQFTRHMISSFPSVQATLVHMVESEWVWSERWYGHSPTTQQVQEFMPDQSPTLVVLKERWHAVESSVRRYLASLGEDDLKKELRYVNRQGEAWIYPLWQALFHLVNHQTYHRGQVTTLLRQLGVAPPQIDYLIAYDRGLRP